MSLYIVLEREIEGVDSFVNGHALAGLSDQAEGHCIGAGVKPLMSFFSSTEGELDDLLNGDEEPPSGMLNTEEQWFSPRDGLSMLAVIEQHFGGDRNVLADINEWKRVLERAKQEGVRWHVAVDY